MTKHLREIELESEVVYEGIFLKLRRDRARMPDGSERGREYVVHPGAAAMVPLMPDDRILVERQFRYPLRDVFVEIPAGKIDPGETALDTARRELVEETGYRARQWAPLTRIHPAIGFANEAFTGEMCILFGSSITASSWTWSSSRSAGSWTSCAPGDSPT